MDGRAKGRQHQKKRITAMSNPSDQESGGWLESPGFGALDWASEKHSVIVVDQAGKGATGGKTFYGFSRDFVCKLFAVNCFELEDPGTVFDLIQVV